MSFCGQNKLTTTSILSPSLKMCFIQPVLGNVLSFALFVWWSDPKVTLLTFMAGICGKSLTSLYLLTPRFELPPLGAL